MNKKVLIIGSGIVGGNLKNEIGCLNPDVYDKYKPEKCTKSSDYYDFAFVCVPTDYKGKENPCDITEVRNAILENEAGLYIVKSTVLPGTVDKLKAETGKRIVFSPEYYGITKFAKNYTYEFTTIGGERDDCNEVVQLLQNVYDCRHKFYVVTSKEAELIKYMNNSFLANKVSFCVQFWEIAQKIGADYEMVREGFLLDPRTNPSHTFVFDDHPYWTSHCFDKDVRAIAETFDAKYLLNLVDYNEEMKKKSEKK